MIKNYHRKNTKFIKAENKKEQKERQELSYVPLKEFNNLKNKYEKILDRYRADEEQFTFKNNILEYDNQVLKEDNEKMLKDIQLIGDEHSSLQELVKKQKKEIEILKQNLKQEQIDGVVANQLFKEENNENEKLKKQIEELKKQIKALTKYLTKYIYNDNKKLLPNQMKYISKVENKKQNYNTRKRYVLIQGLDTRPKFNIYCSKEHLRNKQVNNY